MNLDMNQHETYITAPDDASKIVREAIPPATQMKVVIARPSDERARGISGTKQTARHRGTLYGMPFAWRGLYLFGITIGIVGAWFVAAWIRHGRMPLGLSIMPQVRLSFGSPPSPIYPPTWLLAVAGVLSLISIAMMLSGTQDANPKMKFRQDKPPKASDATSEPAPDANSSAHRR